MYIFIYPSRLYASYSSIHITIPEFSPTNLVWNYTDKTDILKCFHFKSVKSFIQFNHNSIVLKKNSIQSSHFPMFIIGGRNYLRQNSLTSLFNVNLCVNIQLFSVFHITTSSEYCMWLHVAGYHSDRCGLQSDR